MSHFQLQNFESQRSSILGKIDFLQINTVKVTECSNVCLTLLTVYEQIIY